MRKSKEEITNLDKARKAVLKEFFQLSEKAMQHIEMSIVATKTCGYCNAKGEAVKTDADGKCIECHGTMKIADVARRDWAAEEINSRNAPKPKPQEITVSDKTNTEEFEQEIKKLPREVLDEQLKMLGVTFNTEVE